MVKNLCTSVFLCLPIQVMNERTWAGFYGKVPSRSVIAPHPSQRHLPDPNNERDAGAIRYWIQFSDFYQMPYITYFNSVDDLVERLETVTPAELAKISELMRSYNAVVKRQLTDRWMKLLQRIARRSPNAPH